MYEIAGMQSRFKSNSALHNFIPKSTSKAVAVTFGGEIIAFENNNQKKAQHFLNLLLTNGELRILYP